jgi:hypothetical protein
MADKWPLANGSYSSAANWNGGTLPVDGDVVYADGRTITIDQNINLPNASFRTTARSGGTAGGSFTAASGTYSITVLEAIAGTTAVFATSGNAAISWNNILFRGSDTGANGWGLQVSGGGNQTFTNCVATGGNFGTNAVGINASVAASAMTGTLSLTNGASSQAPALIMSGSGHNFTLSGSCVHGLQRTAVFGGSGTYTFTTETTAGTTTTTAAKITTNSNATVTITRNDASTVLDFPNTWTATHFSLGSNSTVNYTGDIKQANSEIIADIATGATFRHYGTIYGPDAAFGSIAIATAANAGAKAILDKLQRNATSGLMPSLGNGWCLRSSSQINAATEASSVTLVPSTSVGDPPAISNVRSGTVYHFSTLTGTCAVPGAGSVAAGVPVDATVGTAVLTQSQVQTGCNAALAAYDTNGVASADDLASVGVDLTPVMAKLPESGRASTQASVDSIAVALAGSAPVEPTGRIAQGGKITAYIGDDFRVRSGTALTIPVSDPAGGLYTKLTALGVNKLRFGVTAPGKAAGLITGAVASITQSGSGASQICTLNVEITNCGAGLPPGDQYLYQIEQEQTHSAETDDFVEIEGKFVLKQRAV